MNEYDVKTKILEAASHEFAKRGVSGARTESIAKRAKCNKAMIHYYFGSKQALYQNTIVQSMEAFHQTITEQHDHVTDVESFLEWLVGGFLDYHAKKPFLSKLLIWELAEGTPVLGQILNEQFKKPTHSPLPLISSKISELVDQKKVSISLPLQEVLLTISGLMASAVMQSTVAVDFFGMDRKKFIENRKKAIFAILTPALKGGGSL